MSTAALHAKSNIPTGYGFPSAAFPAGYGGEWPSAAFPTGYGYGSPAPFFGGMPTPTGYGYPATSWTDCCSPANFNGPMPSMMTSPYFGGAAESSWNFPTPSPSWTGAASPAAWTGAGPSSWFGPYSRFVAHELNYVPFRPTSMFEFYSLSNPIRYDRDGNRLLSLVYDLKGFKPEEINLTCLPKERTIVVEASHEVKDLKEHNVKRTYSRKYILSEDIKVDLSKVEIKCNFTNEGLLVIEAVLPRATPEELKKHLTTTLPATHYTPITVKTM